MQRLENLNLSHKLSLLEFAVNSNFLILQKNSNYLILHKNSIKFDVESKALLFCEKATFTRILM